MTLGTLIENYDNDVKIVLLEWQYVNSTERDEVTVFAGTIGELKESEIISGDFRTSRASHIMQDWYTDITGTLQVTM